MDPTTCPATCQSCKATANGYECATCLNNRVIKQSKIYSFLIYLYIKDPFNDCITCDFNYPVDNNGIC